MKMKLAITHDDDVLKHLPKKERKPINTMNQ